MFNTYRLYLVLLLTLFIFSIILFLNKNQNEKSSYFGIVIENQNKTNPVDFFLAVEPYHYFMNRTVGRIYHDDYYDSDKCQIEDWNTIETDKIPNEDYHQYLMSIDWGKDLLNKSPSPLAAFAYSDYIAVTLTSERTVSHKVYCRYYDCKMKEMIGKHFVSRNFPRSTVFCARQKGAVYISVTDNLEDVAEFPIRIVRRDAKKPPHYLTVCLAPLYGEEPKFLQLVDFIEYYKLQGATFFHIYVRNVSNYDRILLDDYVRTGEVELIQVHDHYWRADFMWHRVQNNDCHFRSKFFSKWTAFVDIDERIEMKKYPELRIVDLLDQTTPNVSTLHFSTDWIIKNGLSPEKYINDNQLKNEMIFRKFTNTSTKTDTYKQPKCIIRPERIAVMSIHHPRAVYDNSKIAIVNYRIAAIRHYRNSFHKLFPGQINVMFEHGPWRETNIAPWISGNLTTNILNRVKYLFDIEIPPNDIQERWYDRECSKMSLEKIKV